MSDDTGKASGFRWTHNGGGQEAEWIKLPGEDENVITGNYRLKSDPYKSIYVSEKDGKLTSQVEEGPALPLIGSAEKF